mgnify:CR=1 FL=1
MEETLLAIEKHGVSLIMALGMGYALYKVLMFMLVKKAESFESSHLEMKQNSGTINRDRKKNRKV